MRPNAVQRVKPQQTLAKATEWRAYGGLQVNWSEWETMGDSQVAPIIDNRGQSLFIAMDCSNRNVNLLIPMGIGGWESLNALTKDLTRDRCNPIRGSKQNSRFG